MRLWNFAIFARDNHKSKGEMCFFLQKVDMVQLFRKSISNIYGPLKSAVEICQLPYLPMSMYLYGSLTVICCVTIVLFLHFRSH